MKRLLVGFLISMLVLCMIPIGVLGASSDPEVSFEVIEETPVSVTIRATIVGDASEYPVEVLLNDLSVPLLAVNYVKVDKVVEEPYTVETPVYKTVDLTEEEILDRIDSYISLGDVKTSSDFGKKTVGEKITELSLQGIEIPLQEERVIDTRVETAYREVKSPVAEWNFYAVLQQMQTTVPSSTVMDITINTGTAVRPDTGGWGSKGVLALKINGKTYYDMTNSSWWDNSWLHRNVLSFKAADIGTDLTDFPVMVKLDSSNFNFNQAQDNGQDIRFVDKDDSTPLKYEIEKWDKTGQEAIVWVQVPQIDAASNYSDYIYIYYGNPDATDAQDSEEVWADTGAAMVQHLSETSGTFSDSTSNGNNGTVMPATSYDQGVVWISDCDSLTGWTGTSLTLETGVKWQGNASIKNTITSPSIGEAYTLICDPSGTWNLGNREVFFRWMCNRASTDFTSAELLISDGTNTQTTGITFAAGSSMAITVPIDTDLLDESHINSIAIKVVAKDTTSFYERIDYVVAAGTAILGVDGIAGNSVQFDGINDYISYGTSSSVNPGSNSWTVEGWTFINDYYNTQCRFCVGAYYNVGTGNPGWQIDYESSTSGVPILFSDGTHRVTGTIACDTGYQPPDTKNRWAHIVVVFNRSTGKAYAYINGVLQSGQVDISSVTNSVVYNNIISSGVVGSYKINGNIDELRFYNRVLSADEVKANYMNSSNTLLHYGGEDPTFTVTTLEATDVGMDAGTHATLNGSLDSLGTVPECDVWFEWGYDTSYGNVVGRQENVTETGTFSATISHFEPGATVHYRFVAENVNGIVYGENMTLTVAATASYNIVKIVPLAFAVGAVGTLIAMALTGNIGIGLITLAALTVVGFIAIQAIIQALW